MIAISFLKSNDSRLDTIKKINNTDTDYLHVDIMDGIFIDHESNNDIDDLYNDLLESNKKLDIHLMVKYPLKYIEKFKSLNPEIITVHAEIDNVSEYLDLIKKNNIKAGLAVNPETAVEIIKNYNPDYVLIMGVNPGMGGQTLIPECVEKVEYLKKHNLLCGIDGGVNNETIDVLRKFDIIISGSYVCMSDNFQERIDSLR